METNTTRPMSTAVFLAHTSHADRARRDDACALCATVGAARVTWGEFVALYPAN